LGVFQDKDDFVLREESPDFDQELFFLGLPLDIGDFLLLLGVLEGPKLVEQLIQDVHRDHLRSISLFAEIQKEFDGRLNLFLRLVPYQLISHFLHL